MIQLYKCFSLSFKMSRKCHFVFTKNYRMKYTYTKEYTPMYAHTHVYPEHIRMHMPTCMRACTRIHASARVYMDQHTQTHIRHPAPSPSPSSSTPTSPNHTHARTPIHTLAQKHENTRSLLEGVEPRTFGS